MVKQPGCLGRTPTDVTRLGETPSGAQRTAGRSLVQEIPMGRVPWWSVADQSDLTRNHVLQATDSSSSVAPLFILGLFFGLSAKLDPFQPPQLSSKKCRDDINGLKVFLPEW